MAVGMLEDATPLTQHHLEVLRKITITEFEKLPGKCLQKKLFATFTTPDIFLIIYFN